MVSSSATQMLVTGTAGRKALLDEHHKENENEWSQLSLSEALSMRKAANQQLSWTLCRYFKACADCHAKHFIARTGYATSTDRGVAPAQVAGEGHTISNLFRKQRKALCHASCL